MSYFHGHLVVLGIFCGVAVLATAIYFLGSRQVQLTQLAWQEFALRNGLLYEQPVDSDTVARVRGKLHGRSFVLWKVYIVQHGRQSTDISRTRMHLEVLGMPDGFLIYERPSGLIGQAVLGGLTGVATMMGHALPPEFKTGDAAFDENWVTRGFDADLSRAWITAGERKQTLLDMVAEGELETLDDGLIWEGTHPTTVEAIETLVLTLERYAERLEDP